MPTLKQIVDRHKEEYLALYGSKMLSSHKQALTNISACHTPMLGGHRYTCNDCGTVHYQYHSCRNRSCPACQQNKTEDWIGDRTKQLLPCSYFHLIFTVPSELRSLIRSNQKPLLAALMKAAGDSIKVLVADTKNLGGNTGILAVLHTWGANLSFYFL